MVQLADKIPGPAACGQLPGAELTSTQPCNEHCIANNPSVTTRPPALLPCSNLPYPNLRVQAIWGEGEEGVLDVFIGCVYREKWQLL